MNPWTVSTISASPIDWGPLNLGMKRSYYTFYVAHCKGTADALTRAVPHNAWLLILHFEAHDLTDLSWILHYVHLQRNYKTPQRCHFSQLLRSNASCRSYSSPVDMELHRTVRGYFLSHRCTTSSKNHLQTHIIVRLKNVTTAKKNVGA